MDALAPRADEGRDKLRKATVRSKYPLTRRYPNGETWLSKPQSPYGEYIAIREGTRGTETSKYPEEEKENIDFLSSGERKGKSQTRGLYLLGLWTAICELNRIAERFWESQPERVKASYAKSEDS